MGNDQDYSERLPVSPDGQPSPQAPQTPGSPETPGSPANPLALTDPRMMRALAHPARLAIWQYLGLEGPATATECAAVAGLSPSACSYHLRTLARYGFVEEDRAHAADGRERPWRSKITALRLATESTTPAIRDAARLLSESVHASAEELRESYHDRQTEYPADWQAALGTNYDILHVTPDELNLLKQRLVELFGPYRRLSRAERPAGARRVHVAIDLNPWFEPEDAGG